MAGLRDKIVSDMNELIRSIEGDIMRLMKESALTEPDKREILHKNVRMILKAGALINECQAELKAGTLTGLS